MKKILLFLILISSFSGILAQDYLQSVNELQKLLQQRQDRFAAYTQAADRRSGIFGNKTKKDLESSREILLGIVQLDNQIMDELNRAIAVRGMAKADYTVDAGQYQRTIDQLSFAADTLEKQLNVATETKASLQKKTTMQQWAIYFLCAAILLGLWQRFRMLRR